LFWGCGTWIWDWSNLIDTFDDKGDIGDVSGAGDLRDLFNSS